VLQYGIFSAFVWYCIGSFATYFLRGYSDARAYFVLCGSSFIHLLDGILFKVLQDKKIQQLFHKKSRCQFDDFYF